MTAPSARLLSRLLTLADFVSLPEVLDFRVLGRVSMGLGISDIARGLMVFPATATATLDRLIDLGYVQKSDGRYGLTPLGNKQLSTLEVEFAEVARDLMCEDRLMHSRAHTRLTARREIRELVGRLGRGEPMNYAECMRLEEAGLAVRVKRGDKVYAEPTPYGQVYATRSGAKTGSRRGLKGKSSRVTQ